VNKGTICVICFAAHKSFPYTRHSPPLPPSLPPYLRYFFKGWSSIRRSNVPKGPTLESAPKFCAMMRR